MGAMASVRLYHPITGEQRVTGHRTVQQYLDNGWALLDPEPDEGRPSGSQEPSTSDSEGADE